MYLWRIRRILDGTGVAAALSATGLEDRHSAALIKLVGRDTPTTGAVLPAAPEHAGGF